MAQSLRFLFSTPPATGRRPAIFLDRDGVINERILNGYVTHWHEFQFIEGAVYTLRELSRLRLPIMVISNQSGIGKGLVSRDALEHLTGRFVATLRHRGGRIDGVYYCPHRPDEGCPCRKPKPGLLLRAASDWRIDLGASVLIGDAVTDIQAAQAAGCRSILIDRDSAAAGSAMAPLVESKLEPIVVHDVAQVPQVVARQLERSRLVP
jgi:D-glycero-D-manno-heptose 1,7-bisphosphate phosphatase